MKVGDLVRGTEDGSWQGSMGIVIGFDSDDDPIVGWTGHHAHEGSNIRSPGCGEYRSQVEVVNEAR
tara:strand:- start:180 stop:377 length:198 start_codon:yes stop_codon:yes gene_type:complete